MRRSRAKDADAPTAKIAGIFARNCTFGKVPLSRRRHTGPPLRRRARALVLYLRLK